MVHAPRLLLTLTTGRQTPTRLPRARSYAGRSSKRRGRRWLSQGSTDLNLLAFARNPSAQLALAVFWFYLGSASTCTGSGYGSTIVTVGRQTRVILFFAAVAGSAILLTAASPAAKSSPVRECGRLPSQLAGNITTRRVSCSEARRVVTAWGSSAAKRRSGSGPVRGLYCRYRDTAYEAADIRCTGSRGRVVRWQTSS